MNGKPNRTVSAFAARQIQNSPPLTRVFVEAVSYLAAYIDNNVMRMLHALDNWSESATHLELHAF